MMKRIVGIVIPLLTCAMIIAQENANVYRVHYLKPVRGAEDKLLAGFKEHNKKYHNKGIMKVSTSRVVSGEKTGWLVRVYGPMTWAQVDEFTADANSKAHRANGAKLVRPHIEKNIGPMYWSPVKDLHYNPSTSEKPSKMTRITYTHMKPGMNGEFFNYMKKIKEVNEKTNSDASYVVGRLVHGGNKHTFASFSGLDSWAEMESSGLSFSSRYNEVYGEDAWGRFVDQIRKSQVKRHDEMRVYLEDQSTR